MRSESEWKNCTDENYWESDYDVYYIPGNPESGIEDEFGTRYSCPYGWNVLCRNNAKFKTIELPK